MRHRLSLLFALAIPTLMMAGPGLRAQEAPQPPDPKPPIEQPASEAPAVTLAYKFVVGQVQRFNSSAKADLTISAPGGGGALGPIPVTTTTSFSYEERVMGTRKGAGTIAASLEAPKVDLNVVGMDIQLRRKNGKVVATRNGEPVPSDQISGQLAAVEGLMTPRKAVWRRSPIGELEPVSGAVSEVTIPP